MLISRRREAKRRALLQMLDRIPLRTTPRTPQPRVSALPADLAASPAMLPATAPSGEALPRAKQ